MARLCHRKSKPFKSTRSPLTNKGPGISLSTFRNIFHEDLSDLFSFRKARVDTCQFCDETINKINILSQSQGDPRQRAELKELRKLISLIAGKVK